MKTNVCRGATGSLAIRKSNDLRIRTLIGKAERPSMFPSPKRINTLNKMEILAISQHRKGRITNV